MSEDEVEVQPSGDGKGMLEVKKEGLSELRVVFDVTTLVAGDQLVGDEEVSLALVHETGSSDASTASLKDSLLECDPIESASGFSVTATAACENDETELLTDASFTFEVKGAVDPGGRNPKSLKGKYGDLLLGKGERVGSEYAGYSY